MFTETTDASPGVTSIINDDFHYGIVRDLLMLNTSDYNLDSISIISSRLSSILQMDELIPVYQFESINQMCKHIFGLSVYVYVFYFSIM